MNLYLRGLVSGFVATVALALHVIWGLALGLTFGTLGSRAAVAT